MAVAAIGLTPIFPTTVVVPVVVTPVAVRITNSPAVLRFTGEGPAADAPVANIKTLRIDIHTRLAFCVVNLFIKSPFELF
jgi:hypothetical protein